jgi:hypothetical protein
MPDSADYPKLRDHILGLAPERFWGEAVDTTPRMWGAVMEVGHTDMITTVVALVDGTTSLYVSTGYAALGCGEDPTVRRAGQSLIAEAALSLHDLHRSDCCPLPEVGHARFHNLTMDGPFTGDFTLEDLRDWTHRLHRAAGAGFAVGRKINELIKYWREGQQAAPSQALDHKRTDVGDDERPERVEMDGQSTLPI